MHALGEFNSELAVIADVKGMLTDQTTRNVSAKDKCKTLTLAFLPIRAVTSNNWIMCRSYSFHTSCPIAPFQIVHAQYPPLQEDLYSERVTSTISRCLTVEPADRPDVIQVSAHIADIMLNHMDVLRIQNGKLEKKLEHERRRTQK